MLTHECKGNASYKHLSIKQENIDLYYKNKPRIFATVPVKTAEPNVFELKHRLVWIEYNGEIPPGYNIQFKDGNKQNICIENLYMISRSEQMKTQNSMYARYPEDVQYLIKLKGALNRQINKATKKNES